MSSAVGGVLVAVGVLMALFGMASVVWGVLRLRRSRRLAQQGRAATGVVVDNQTTSHSRGGGRGSYVTFRPVIEYRTEMGQQVTAVGPVGTRTSFVKGATVGLRYDPEHPEQVELVSGAGRGSGGVAAIVIGLALAAVAAIFIAVVLAITAQPMTCVPRYGPSTRCVTSTGF
jgi:hypothetical protein